MSVIKNPACCLKFGQSGWKYYNSIGKKAMEQEFSWSGLFLSLSIAFFVITISAYTLSLINQALVAKTTDRKFTSDNIHLQENGSYLTYGVTDQ
ncbi:MAG: hypothetical protein PHS62_04860 [Patescibacteria group bacterium]|nr:hypothetical protein [Patescibacteria group bacterium]